MLATQLLRVLQTIPSDVKHDTCVYDSAAQDTIMKEDQNHQDGPFCRLDSLEDDKDSLSSDTSTKDVVQTRPAHDCPVSGGEYIHYNENGSSDCRSPYVAAADLFERDQNLYTDKDVLEYERPELIVCYKEISYHVVKDICIDEGMPANRNFFIDSSNDDQSGNLKDYDHCKATGAVDAELSQSNGLAAATSLENTDFSIANQQGSEKERNGILPSEGSLYTDAAVGGNLGETKQEDGAIIGATNNTAMHAPAEESFVGSSLPIQEFGTRSFLRSFLNSLDVEGDKVEQLPDQSTEAGPKENVQTSILCYNSEVETRSITFNFNSPSPVVVGITDGKPELREVIDQKDEEDEVQSDSRQVKAHSVSNSDMKHDDEEDKSAESHILQHEDRDTDGGSALSLRKYARGESSFSADDFIVHSGPITFSGSISLHSDGSATSGRSFAFPILPSEWNNSPERMSDAERRRFRKHKGWRSGVLCCRF